MKKRLLSTLLALAMCLSVLLASPLVTTASAAGFTRSRTYNGQFTDVPDTQWYYQGVNDSYELGLMSGTSAEGTLFSPSGMFTVAEAMAVAARLHNIYNGGTVDLPVTSSDWRQNAANYCLSNGLCSSGQFDNYYRNATRAEMVSLFAAALPDSQWTAIKTVTELPDVSASTDYYSAIFKLYNAGILVGNDAYGTCNPYSYITRAEVAVIAARCADASLRDGRTFTPLSQREAPEIPGNLSSSNYKVSSGLMCFYDTDTATYGYIDGSGNKKIAAQYEGASQFSAYGYACVANNGLLGLLRSDGALMIPIEYYEMVDLGYGAYKGTTSYKGKYCLIINGERKTDPVYDNIYANGLYFFAKNSTGSWDLYDINGTRMTTFASEPRRETGSPLFAVRDGSKWALATEKGPITEYLYDSITLYEDSSLAVLNYGSQHALAGENGVVLNLGEYLIQSVMGDYALVHSGSQYALANATGIVSEVVTIELFLSKQFNMSIYSVNNGSVLVRGYDLDDNWTMALDATHKKTYALSISGAPSRGYARLDDGTYFLGDGTPCQEVAEVGNSYLTFAVNGKYGVAYRGKTVLEPAYDSSSEAIAAYGYYKIDKENGKPVVVYGNPVTGFNTYSIQYFKNNMYFDDIKDVGEGYYACKFNTSWYLLHA